MGSTLPFTGRFHVETTGVAALSAAGSEPFWGCSGALSRVSTCWLAGSGRRGVTSVGACNSGKKKRVRSEKKYGLASPGWTTVCEKSMESAARRGGVPVFSRMRENPSCLRDSLSLSTAGRPSPPDGTDSFPMKIRPRSEVPVVRITCRAGMNPWRSVSMPMTWRCCASVGTGAQGSVLIPMTASSMTVRWGWQAMTRCIRRVYALLSHWARVAWTAGPRLVFSVFSWSEVKSALKPISPPSASSSKTRWLLASPPIEGLQGMRAIASRRLVTRRVLTPMRAAMRAASAPAWPPPTTMMSYLSSMRVVYHK